MNYILKPSLEHIALVKLATTLWNPHDIRDLMTKFCIPLHNSELRKKWQKIEDIILEKVSQLPLPELLKKKTLDFIRHIGFQILNWVEYHRDKFGFNIGIPDEFYWLPRGAVDKKKMAEVLIRDEDIDITTRYKLACNYCLEKNIPELWDRIPEDRKMFFYNEEDPLYVLQHDLVLLWTYDLKGELTKVRNMFEIISNRRCSPYQYAFECAASVGNGVATEYFLQRMNSVERKESLVATTASVATGRFEYHHAEYLKEYYSDILCVLLSHMDNSQQEELFKNFTYHVLKCFLDWPRQIFFMETASCMWSFLSGEIYEALMRKIIDKLKQGYKDFNYQKLFGEMWQQSPDVLKKYVLDGYTIDYFILVLFKIRDEINIKLVFKDVTLMAKNKLICSFSGREMCKDLIEGEEWGLLEFLIQECFSSKDEMSKFKIDFKSSSHYVLVRDNFEKRTKYDKFLRLLDDLICKFSKRKCIEDDNCGIKKLCN